MEIQNLSNKPLVEAIFELRWDLANRGDGALIDPHYKLLVGRVYDRVKDQYRYHQQLPACAMPDEIAAYVVQHQFRATENGWPLVQVGPGVVTLNDTDGYDWNSFKSRVEKLLTVLYETYPDSAKKLKVKSLLLRYIDAVEFDYEHDDIWKFLGKQLKVDVKLCDRLFENTGVGSLPLGFDMAFVFPSTKPAGAAKLRVVRGEKSAVDALIWETQIQSKGVDVPSNRKSLVDWVDEAHALTHDWFFKMIEGDLYERFK